MRIHQSQSLGQVCKCFPPSDEDRLVFQVEQDFCWLWSFIVVGTHGESVCSCVLDGQNISYFSSQLQVDAQEISALTDVSAYTSQGLRGVRIGDVDNFVMRAIKGRTYEMVEAGIRANKVFLRSFLVRCDTAQQDRRVSYNVSARLDGNANLPVVLLGELISNFPHLLEEITRLRHLLTIPISHSKTSSYIDILHFIEVLKKFECISHGLYDYFLISLLHIGPYVLMQSHNMNVVLLGHFNSSMKVIFIDAELAFGTTSDHMVAAACSHLRIDSQIYVFSSQLVLIVFQSMQSANVEHDTQVKGIIYLFWGDEVLSVHDLMRLVAA